MNPSVKKKRVIHQYNEGQFTCKTDEIVEEYPLTVMVNGEEFVTLVCSPEHLKELVIGFLASEGVIRFEKEIKRFTIDESMGFALIHQILQNE